MLRRISLNSLGGSAAKEREKIKHQKLFSVLCSIIVVLLLAACEGVSTVPSESVVSADTPVPPTDTPTLTPIPLTATLTPTTTVAPNEYIASEIEDMVGIWEQRFIGAVAYVQYEKDGTSKLVNSLEDLEKGIVGIPGTFWFEGNVFHVADDYGEGTYEVTVRKENDAPVRLDFVVIDDPNSNRAADLTAGMTWVAPSLQVSKMEDSASSISDVQYLIYLPEGYDDQQESWPLLLFLHGGGQDEPPPELIDQGKNYPLIIVAPLMSIPNWSGDVVDNVLNEVTEQYRVDEDRIYVTGLSIGGFGTWTVALAYPERFAAIAPVAGGGDPEMVEAIKDLPVWVFHGAKDDSIPLERAQEMVDALEKVGGNVIFTVYPEAGHDAWTETYSNPELYEWFLKHHR